MTFLQTTKSLDYRYADILIYLGIKFGVFFVTLSLCGLIVLALH